MSASAASKKLPLTSWNDLPMGARLHEERHMFHGYEEPQMEVLRPDTTWLELRTFENRNEDVDPPGFHLGPRPR